MNAVAPAPVADLTLPSYFADLEDVEEVGDPGSIMIYGKPGSWKTSIAASIAGVPGMDRVLYIDYDNGSEVLGNLPYKNIKIMRIDTLAPGAYEYSQRIMAEITAPGPSFWNAVVVDALDVWQDMAEKAVKLRLQAEAAALGLVMHGAAPWGQVGIESDEFVRKLHNNPNFVGVIVAHSEESTKGPFAITPKLSGKAKSSIAAIPSVVAYTEFVDDGSGADVHTTTLGKSSYLVTKNRYRLPDKIQNFNLPDMYRAIRAKQAPITTTAAATAA